MAAVTGEVLPFGLGRKISSSDAKARIQAAKAAIPAHDPHQDLLDAMAAAVNIVGDAQAGLTNEQMKALTFQTERAAERGVGMYARRIRSWHQAIVGGAFMTGLLLGCAGAWRWHAAADISGMTCQDQTGGRVCYIWVTPPQQGKAGR